MSENRKIVKPADIPDNVFSLIADDWFLLTAGTEKDGFNTMTASWGWLGELWNKKVNFVFVIPQSHTWNFTEKNQLYTMSFFEEEHRPALKYCGTHSGRDVDKMAETGLTPFQPMQGTVAFEQARLIMVCRKLYYQDLQPSQFLFDGIEELYPEKGYHRMYIGEVVKVLKK